MIIVGLTGGSARASGPSEGVKSGGWVFADALGFRLLVGRSPLVVLRRRVCDAGNTRFDTCGPRFATLDEGTSMSMVLG